ncbi:hypothetical protein BOTNAR_0330g00040 [Botryotinia narcissicola]|uniref:Uncharacterized protein n=1 Tax=Botryotinia narcissicola TaxID=278944 RepID=A0A4Z1I0J8_9HELO|nr:hypothetical protein BOTNAR_0330g00040 [Botryotinia narcissicola]
MHFMVWIDEKSEQGKHRSIARIEERFDSFESFEKGKRSKKENLETKEDQGGQKKEEVKNSISQSKYEGRPIAIPVPNGPIPMLME